MVDASTRNHWQVLLRISDDTNLLNKEEQKCCQKDKNISKNAPTLKSLEESNLKAGLFCLLIISSWEKSTLCFYENLIPHTVQYISQLG